MKGSLASWVPLALLSSKYSSPRRYASRVTRPSRGLRTSVLPEGVVCGSAARANGNWVASAGSGATSTGGNVPRVLKPNWALPSSELEALGSNGLVPTVLGIEPASVFRLTGVPVPTGLLKRSIICTTQFTPTGSGGVGDTYAPMLMG